MTTGDGIAVAAKVAGVCFLVWLIGVPVLTALFKFLFAVAVVIFIWVWLGF